MTGLIKKDFYQMRRFGASTFVIPVLFIVLAFVNRENGLFFYMMASLVMLSVVNSLVFADEKSGWMTYQKTLPLSGAAIVASYYLFGLGLCALYQLAQFVVGLFVWPHEMLFFCASLTVSVTLIMAALEYFIIFRFGIKKVRVVFFVVFGGAAGLGVFFEKFYSGTVPNAPIETLLPVFSFLAILLSYALSVRHYNRTR